MHVHHVHAMRVHAMRLTSLHPAGGHSFLPIDMYTLQKECALSSVDMTSLRSICRQSIWHLWSALGRSVNHSQWGRLKDCLELAFK